VLEHLRGRLVSRRPDRAVVEAGGVGYLLHLPLSTVERLPRADGAEVLLVVHEQIREDRHDLYGFATEQEREYFRLLLEVNGVGPGTALGILSFLPFDAFRAAVLGGDAAALTRVKGVGRKIAGRMLVELAEPLRRLGPAPATGGAPVGPAVDAALALAALGFDRGDAEAKAAAAARALGPAAGPGEIVREVLRTARGS
jgi:Holliday junction DNA helicase RuvA